MSSYEVNLFVSSVLSVLNSTQIFLSTPPWGLLSENHIYQLVVRENDRPDRPGSNVMQRCGLTDTIWRIMEAAWEREATLRPAFSEIVELWQIWSEEDSLDILQPMSNSNSFTGQIFMVMGQRGAY